MTGPEARAYLEAYSARKGEHLGTEGMTDGDCIAFAGLVKSIEKLESKITAVWGNTDDSST